MLQYGQQRMESPNPYEFGFLTNQDALIAPQRLLECNTCSFLTWLQATDFQTGHAVLNRIDELLIKKHTIPDGYTISPIKERAKHVQFLSYLAAVCQPGQLCVMGHPTIPCCFDSLYWPFKKLDWSGILNVSCSLSKKCCCAF
jgi:hypothetical protein